MSTATTTQAPTSTSSKQKLPVHIKVSTSRDAIPAATSTLISAFSSDPVTSYMFHHLAPSSRPAAIESLFTLSSNAALLAGGELWSASTATPAPPTSASTPDFQAAATIFPPSSSLDSFGASSLPSLLLGGGGLAPALWRIGPSAFTQRMNAYNAATTPAKKSTFPAGETFYYVQLIGAAEGHRGKGLAPALIRELQARAEKEGKKVYLEASNEGARRVYEKLGFVETAAVIRLGEGECGADGEVKSGGEAVGVPLWPMVWVPKGGSTAGM